jgi:hypothetical protein
MVKEVKEASDRDRQQHKKKPIQPLRPHISIFNLSSLRYCSPPNHATWNQLSGGWMGKMNMEDGSDAAQASIH